MAKIITEKPSGQYIAIPHTVMRTLDYRSLKGTSVKLLNALAFQYNGRNNGALCTAWSVMHEQHGFRSKATLTHAIQELVNADLITRTREGYFQNPGGQCALYALNWYAIHECTGKNLDLKRTIQPLRKFSMEQNKKPSTETVPGSTQKLYRGNGSSTQKLY
jgi:hypothetical protein